MANCLKHIGALFPTMIESKSVLNETSLFCIFCSCFLWAMFFMQAPSAERVRCPGFSCYVSMEVGRYYLKMLILKQKMVVLFPKIHY